jgi:CheY-like chemotaxis protein
MKINLSLSKNQARDSARLEAEFLTNISHEIRIPLNAVIGMTSLALDEDISSKARECVINARTSAITLLNVLDDIIDFSMMEADGLKLNMNRFDFYLWFEGLIVSHSMSARQKGLEFQYVIDEGVPRWMVSDALRLSKIVDAILSNAINFTKNGFIKIKVLIDQKTISENQSKNINLNFLIKDTGCGMSPDAVEKPFESLSRVYCPTSRVAGVAGRGLIICQRLVAAFNGHISLTSELGVGTEFSIDIPVEVLDIQDNFISQVKNRENNVQALADLSSLNGMKVLLVEDHPFNRQMMMVMLGKMGLVVDVAVNGSEALTKLNSMPSYYDVILMDIQMPVMDGMATTREIREQAIFNDLPIIAITANAMSDEKDACIRAGVQAYLVKPINPSALQDVLLSLADRRKSA